MRRGPSSRRSATARVIIGSKRPEEHDLLLSPVAIHQVRMDEPKLMRRHEKRLALGKANLSVRVIDSSGPRTQALGMFSVSIMFRIFLQNRLLSGAV